jgi:hypothetical protein
MISWLKRLVAPVAALAMFAVLPITAAADTISYTTSLVFAASGTNILDTGAYSLTFNGANIVDLSLTKNGAVPLGTAVATTFGSFSTDAASYEVFSGAQFTLSVFQSDPSTSDNNPANLAGEMTGYITFDANAQVTTLHFTSPTSFMIGSGLSFPPSVRYTINQDQTIDNQVLGATEIRGTAAAAPLPGVAVAGMTLFGMVGGAGGLNQLRRRSLLAA